MRGLLVIGHGSRRDEANAMVVELSRALAPCADRPEWDAVEPAFLDLAHPDIAQGYAALVDAGCSEIIAHPFFLFEGNHTARDIPDALAAAQSAHPGTRWTITLPLGLHPGVVHAVRARIEDALEQPGLDAAAADGGSAEGSKNEAQAVGARRAATSSATTAASG
ncbi:CbiX/SirB N-terminal domain-containing protein [Parafrankia sp. FMc2]